jgi:hypothetical protein
LGWFRPYDGLVLVVTDKPPRPINVRENLPRDARLILSQNLVGANDTTQWYRQRSGKDRAQDLIAAEPAAASSSQKRRV